ncbi:LEM domain containing 1 [Rhinolophus ferrumequinum]|uniref:LEM domain containing 1 n=1 Tax=Rhinolophus ferrumequinum TaxID=59479 RepID=A0A671F9H7_RHIFE|nr:LEM domain-containing protein 1 [Rhinolophus ferrumequinum]KAF6293078.1 LEM domain containing 1 [Rhinolophus ferrumequinum]
MVDVKCLSNSELQNELHKLGFLPGPILSSTRKVYEKKLKQLLVSPPCTSPVMNGPKMLNRAQDYEDSKELNATIILKGNIILSSEKNKGPKKRPKASSTKPKAQDIYCVDYKCSKKTRSASRAPNTRFKTGSNTEDKDYCAVNRSVGSENLERFPVALKLAVFGIFIIVVFVYITVEKKSLFG